MHMWPSILLNIVFIRINTWDRAGEDIATILSGKKKLVTTKKVLHQCDDCGEHT